MVWSHNDNWMVTGDHAGYVKYWQSNMNNVRMFQAHKEPVRGIRYQSHKYYSYYYYYHFMLLGVILVNLNVVIIIIIFVLLLFSNKKKENKPLPLAPPLHEKFVQFRKIK